MKRIITALAITLLASFASAQEATLDTPVNRPAEAKYRVHEFQLSQTQVVVTVQVRDSAESVIRNFDVIDTDSAAFLTALNTVLPGEVGGILRRSNYRILKRLLDAGRISGVTLVP